MTSEEYLQHWGILGMKWGKKKRDNTTRVLQKNTEIHNISGGKRKKTDMLYTSYTKNDNITYRTTYAAQLRLDYDHRKIYDNVYKTKKNIIIASEQKTLDTFKQLFKDDKKGVIEALAKIEIQTNAFNVIAKNMGLDLTDDITKKLSKMGKKKIESEGFDMFMKGMIIDTPARNKYFDSLLKQGYDAMVDPNDKKVSYIEDPLIFMNIKDSLNKKKEIPISEKQLKAAIETYESQY